MRRPHRPLLAALLAAATGLMAAPAHAGPAPAQADPMAEYRQTFAAKGPGWLGGLGWGEATASTDDGRTYVVPLDPPSVCFVKGCDGARFTQRGMDGGIGALVEKKSCRLAGEDKVYPFAIVIRQMRSKSDRDGVRFEGCAEPGLPWARVAGPRIAPPSEAPPPTLETATSAAEARRAIDHLAMSRFEALAAPNPRPWHELSWLAQGRGQAGRLFDLCTGAVVARPALARAWSWETGDPRTLSSADRQALVAWRAELFASGWACGTMFQIATLGADARKLAPDCPADISPDAAFVAYVRANPAARSRNDLVQTVADALVAAGCRRARP